MRSGLTPLEFYGEADRGSRVTARDRLVLAALTEYESSLCRCGQPRFEAMSEDHDPGNPAAASVYVAGAPWRCHACTAVAHAERVYRESLHDDHVHEMDGLAFGVELVPRG